MKGSSIPAHEPFSIRLSKLAAWMVGTAVAIMLVLMMLVFSLDAYNEWESRKRQGALIEQAYREKLLPATAFVRGFVARENRLPTDHEMVAAGWIPWTSAGGPPGVMLYRERPSWGTGWGMPGRDFMVETSVPEWNLFYKSWDDQRIEANWE